MERRSSSQSEDEYSSLELSASGDQVRSAERTSRTMEPQQLTSGYQNQCDEEEIAKTIARDLPRAQKKQKKRRIEEVEGYERKRRRQRERERSGKEQFQQVRRKGGRSGEGLKLYKEAKGGAEDRAGCGTEWERVSGESMTAGEGGIGRAKGNTGKEFAPAGESTSATKLKLISRERSSKYRQKRRLARES